MKVAIAARRPGWLVVEEARDDARFLGASDDRSYVHRALPGGIEPRSPHPFHNGNDSPPDDIRHPVDGRHLLVSLSRRSEGSRRDTTGPRRASHSPLPDRGFRFVSMGHAVLS